MKYLAIGALLLTVLCGAVLILPSLGVVLAGQQATNQMAVQVQNQATRESDPGAGDGSTGYVSEDALESILEDQQGHSERMADKIVQVAVSGDVAQTATALSGDWSTFGIFAAIVIGGLLFLFVLGSRGGGQEGQR